MSEVLLFPQFGGFKPLSQYQEPSLDTFNSFMSINSVRPVFPPTLNYYQFEHLWRHLQFLFNVQFSSGNLLNQFRFMSVAFDNGDISIQPYDFERNYSACPGGTTKLQSSA